MRSLATLEADRSANNLDRKKSIVIVITSSPVDVFLSKHHNGSISITKLWPNINGDSVCKSWMTLTGLERMVNPQVRTRRHVSAEILQREFEDDRLLPRPPHWRSL